MTEKEYLKKRDALAVPDAPIEVIAKAIEELDLAWKIEIAKYKAQDDFYESSADLDDI